MNPWLHWSQQQTSVLIVPGSLCMLKQMGRRYKIVKSILFIPYFLSQGLYLSHSACLCMLPLGYQLLVHFSWLFWHLHHGTCTLILMNMSTRSLILRTAAVEFHFNNYLTCTKWSALPVSSLILSMFRGINDDAYCNRRLTRRLFRE